MGIIGIVVFALILEVTIVPFAETEMKKQGLTQKENKSIINSERTRKKLTMTFEVARCSLSNIFRLSVFGIKKFKKGANL